MKDNLPIPRDSNPLVPRSAADGASRPRGTADCPRCERRTLAASRAGLAAVFRCIRCKGIWVPRASGADLQQSFPEIGELRRESLELVRQTAAELNLRDAVKYLACPICKERMSRRQFAIGSGIVVDRCIHDGVWFDAGELELAAAYFEAGGPADAARRKRISGERETKRIPIVTGDLGDEATAAMAQLLLWLV